MMADEAEFKRILVGLHHGSPQESLRCAVGLAALLQVELLGLFVKENSLAGLAALPFAREFRLLGGWRKVEPEGLVHELDVAARVAQRAFADAVKRLSTAHDFKVVHGSSAEALLSLSRTGDIVVLGEPGSDADREILDPAAVIDSAFRSASAVMLVPKRVLRSSGTVVAIATEKDDSIIRVARKVASRAQSDLVVLEGCHPDRCGAAGTGERLAPVTRVNPEWAAQLSHPSGIRSLFRNVRERLIVVRRGALDRSAASTIASARRQPVLLVG